ncbi:MAG: trehalose-phosphatase [Nitrospirota bacterium]
MEYLFSQKEKLQDILSDKFILLFLDYDGTLAPIVESPTLATLSKENKGLLKKISEEPNCSLAIISGRSLGDIQSTVGLKGIIYAGNHGLEIDGPKIKFENQISPRLKLIIRHVYKDMVNKLSKINGVLIEDKGLVISVHYRLVAEKDIQELLSIFTEITDPHVVRDKIRIDSGKKVYEVKPPVKWDKGKVVLWFLARQQFNSEGKNVLPIYIGDDVTDEDAFKALKNKGLTVFVGEPGNSEADYYLKNTEEVTKFLRLIIGLKPS